MARKKQNYMYVYEETRHSRRGILAMVLGAASLLIFVILTAICAVLEEGGGPWAGSIGFSAFAAAFCGLVYGLKSFRDSCKSYFFSKAGTLFCGFMVAVWFLIFCAGLAG